MARLSIIKFNFTRPRHITFFFPRWGVVIRKYTLSGPDILIQLCTCSTTNPFDSCTNPIKLSLKLYQIKSRLSLTKAFASNSCGLLISLFCRSRVVGFLVYLVVSWLFVVSSSSCIILFIIHFCLLTLQNNNNNNK